MVITKDSTDGRRWRVMKDGKQVGMCLAVDTVSLDYVQMIPVAWGPDWKPGDPVPKSDGPNTREATAFRFVLGKADAVIPLEG